MRITFLGHAGFIVETPDAMLICDPWLSPAGAFDRAWFQYPSNHHLAGVVAARLREFSGERFVYVSHEHPDHFDRDFLNALDCRDFTLVIPRFSNPRFEQLLGEYECRALRILGHRESIPFGDGELTMYVDDTELNRDSAVVVHAGGTTFFNMNDCKLFDSLQAVIDRHGNPDIFTCQYSGAIWHPVCYEYDEERYRSISKKKYLAKFEAVARAIEQLRPKLYIPSAGPPCFLDEELRHIDDQETNIFPPTERVLDYLEKRLQKHPVPLAHLVPGDETYVTAGRVTVRSLGRRVTASERSSYLQQYALRAQTLPAQSKIDDNPHEVFARLRTELQAKLDRFRFAQRIDVPLFFGLREFPGRLLRVRFTDKTIDEVRVRDAGPFYELVAPAWAVRRVLDRKLTWDEFGLSLRVHLRRDPDVYQPFLYAFLILEIDTVELYCAHMEELEGRRERIIVRSGDKEYSVMRYCPHMGADLCAAHVDERGILTCPRHRWQFDLTAGGQCTASAATIRAVQIRPVEVA
jgi:UDP-MurNAc hydroxylase